jgi:hypothetical protein
MEKDKGDDWRFAAGITLYTNNKYVSKEQILERQPLELNARYKFGRHHVIRFQIPFSFKVDMHGYPIHETPFLNEVMGANAGNEARELWEKMKTDPFDFVRTNQFYYDLLGATLGYDYDFQLKHNLSIFGGFDLSYTQLKFHADYFGVAFSKLDEENITQLHSITYVTNEHRNNCFSVKPLLGFRYLFQKKLLVECSIGYGLTFGKAKGTLEIQPYNSNDVNTTSFWRKNDFNQIITQVSLSYSL